MSWSSPPSAEEFFSALELRSVDAAPLVRYRQALKERLRATTKQDSLALPKLSGRRVARSLTAVENNNSPLTSPVKMAPSSNGICRRIVNGSYRSPKRLLPPSWSQQGPTPPKRLVLLPAESPPPQPSTLIDEHRKKQAKLQRLIEEEQRVGTNSASVPTSIRVRKCYKIMPSSSKRSSTYRTHILVQDIDEEGHEPDPRDHPIVPKPGEGKLSPANGENCTVFMERFNYDGGGLSNEVDTGHSGRGRLARKCKVKEESPKDTATAPSPPSHILLQAKPSPTPLSSPDHCDTKLSSLKDHSRHK